MASSFVGRFVEVGLQEGKVFQGTIAHVDPVQQTLSITTYGQTFTWPKTQITSLSLRDPPAVGASVESAPENSTSSVASPAAAPAPTQTSASASQPATAPAPASVDPASKNDVPAPVMTSAPAPVQASVPDSASGSTSSPSLPQSTASQRGGVPSKKGAQTKKPANGAHPIASANPEPALPRDRKKSKSNKKAGAAVHSPKPTQAPGFPTPNPAPVGFSDDFDFDSALNKFDKKKAFEDFKNADKTDPAQLLVSHNKATPGIIHLVRGPNGVGPPPQKPESSRRARGDQEKLGLHEPVLSPNASERSFSRDASLMRGQSRDESRCLSTDRSRGTYRDHTHPRSHTHTPNGRDPVEVPELAAERDDLRARVALLEALSGLSVAPAPPAEGLAKRARTYSVSTWRDHVSQSMADTQDPQPEGRLQFSAAAIPAPSKASAPSSPSLLEVRFVGVDDAHTDVAVFGAIPQKYQRGFTLRPQTAPIFVRRLRAAAFPDAE